MRIRNRSLSVLWALTFLFFENYTAADLVTPMRNNEQPGQQQHSSANSHPRARSGGHTETIASAQLLVDCETLMKPIREKRQTCQSAVEDQVDICVYFASDYNFVIPFLVHHLSLGVNRIWMYNNDEKVPWYNHPSVLCMIAENMVDVQPWFGENALHKGLNHCYFNRIQEVAKKEKKNDTNVWGAVFDIDEMLVLHNDKCINEFVHNKHAPSVAVNWAFFTPEGPKISDFGRTGNVAFMRHDPYIGSASAPRREKLASQIILPHDMLTKRMYENPHIKTISRIGCSKNWVNEHCPEYQPKCIYGHKPIDPVGRYINCGPWTPYTDNDYRGAQLNHYWTLSLADFLRKIHRGKGGSYAKNTDQFRNTGEFFAHSVQGPAPFVNDTSFLNLYGEFFAELKYRCPYCFDTSFYYLSL